MRRGIGPTVAARRSGVLILPAAQQTIGNALAEVIGWPQESFSVALSPTGAEPATHYGYHAWAEQSFFDVWAAETKPDRLVFSEEDFDAMRAALAFDVRASIDHHLSEVASQLGLKLIDGGTIASEPERDLPYA